MFVGQGLTAVIGCCVVFFFVFFEFWIFVSSMVVVVVVDAILCGIAETSLKMEQAVVEDHLRVNTDHGDFLFYSGLDFGANCVGGFRWSCWSDLHHQPNFCWRRGRMASQLARVGARKLYSFDVGGIFLSWLVSICFLGFPCICKTVITKM